MMNLKLKLNGILNYFTSWCKYETIYVCMYVDVVIMLYEEQQTVNCQGYDGIFF